MGKTSARQSRKRSATSRTSRGTARTDEIPRYVIVPDFARIALHDLEPEDQRHLPLFDRWRVQTVEFPLADLHSNIHHFPFIPGYKQHKFEEQDPINIEAVEIMGRLHDAPSSGAARTARVYRNNPAVNSLLGSVNHTREQTGAQVHRRLLCLSDYDSNLECL